MGCSSRHRGDPDTARLAGSSLPPCPIPRPSGRGSCGLAMDTQMAPRAGMGPDVETVPF